MADSKTPRKGEGLQSKLNPKDTLEFLHVKGANFFSDPSDVVQRVQFRGRVGSHAKEILGNAVTWEYRYAMLGLILGLAAIIGGVVLGLHGVTGSTSWTTKFLGLESNINDAAPGVVLFLVGLFMVFITRPKIKLENLKG